MYPGGGRRTGNRGGGRSSGRSGNGDRDQSDASGITGNAETGLFTSAARNRSAGGGGGPVRDGGRRGGRRSGGPRGLSSLPPRPSGGGREDMDGDLNMGGEKKTFANEMSGSVSFSVDNLVQARAVKGLTGIRFKRMKLIIKTTADEEILNGSSSVPRSTVAPTGNAIEAIRTFLRSRYNNGFLNLESMSKDEILRNAKVIPPGRSKGRSDVGIVMMKAAAEMFPETTTISFASNSLTSLEPIAAVSKFFPNLQNLSLKDNNISNYRELEYLGVKKLPNLRELILLDNPVRDRDIEKNKDDIAYRSEVTKIFSSITILDQVPVAPKISFGLGDLVQDTGSKAPALPAPTKGNFFDNPATQSMVLEFLTSYLELFDTNRSMLEHVYDNNATFSYSVVIPASPLQKMKGKAADNWSAYTSQSRNLSRVKDLGQRTARLYFGSRDIIQQGLLKLPDTKHDLSDASKVCVDAWQTGGLLPAVCIYIMVHGEVEEVRRGRDGLKKSFDRSFIIAPAPPNSSAALHGWKCVIISDQLVFRGYNGSEAWKPDAELNVTPGMAAAVAGASAFNNTAPTPGIPGAPATTVIPQAPMEGITPEQHTKALELQKLTGLNYPYAVQCLAASGWDITKGVALTNENRANIPPDAWQQPNF
ncbi:nuclear mRNA export, poly(A)+RNA binding protein [Mortierella claussenii]|nr:nuclear mRNA export, poly(A)+RNA binding protein [Mortierella claussenii]